MWTRESSARVWRRRRLIARLKPRAPRRVDIAPRIVYIVLSASSNASALRLSSLQRGWLGHVDPASVLIYSSSQTLVRSSALKLQGTLNGTIVFDALIAAHRRCGPADWYMIGDDDTHVSPAAVAAFVRARASPHSVYGNLFHNGSGGGRPLCRSSMSGRTKTLQHGWLTGGSGVLLPWAVSRRLAIASERARRAWGWAGRDCKCGDVPLACALDELGVGVSHMPASFLDSCVSCADFIGRRNILSCHAVEAFRSYNVHAKRKGPRDAALVHGVLALRHRRAYHWPSNLSHVLLEDRMATVRSTLCAPRV